MKTIDDGSSRLIKKDKKIVDEFTLLSEETIKKLEAYGDGVELTLSSDGYQYHIGGPERIVSIIKRVNSYGNEEDLWECAVLEDNKVKHIEGYLTEEQALEYAQDWLKYVYMDDDRLLIYHSDRNCFLNAMRYIGSKLTYKEIETVKNILFDEKDGMVKERNDFYKYLDPKI